MAVEMRTEARGMTAEQAKAWVAQMEARMKSFPGFIALISGPTEGGGYRITELWESREAHERWMREVIAPMMQQAGGGEPPSVDFLEVDTFITR